MKNITNIIKTTETTVAAREEYVKAAKAAIESAAKKKTLEEHKKVQRAAMKALAKYNASIQNDAFATIISINTAPALVTLAQVGYYAAAVGLDKDGEVKFEDRPFDLYAFIGFLNDNKIEVSSPDTFRAAVKDAVDLSMLKLAQGLEDIDVVATADKIGASAEVKELAGAKCTDETPESISYNKTEEYLQKAVDALVYVSQENGKNAVRVKRADCRWLESEVKKNAKTGNLMDMEIETRYSKIFRIMRRRIGNELYDVELKEKAEGKKAQ